MRNYLYIALFLIITINVSPTLAGGDNTTGEELGERFHNILITDENGIEHQLSDFQGKVIVIKFWGSWCGTCKQKWPDHQTLFNTINDNENVVFLTISISEPFKTSLAWANDNQYSIPLYHGSNFGIVNTTTDYKFQPIGTPYKLLIDQSGVIRAKRIGFQPHFSEEEILALL